MNAFVEVVKEYDADQYGFILRETQTGEIIDDVASGKSELGLLYLSESNETVLSKLLRKSELVFEELVTAAPHVFINKDHPLADRKCITLDELKPYPYLIFEQGDRNSFYFSEELLSMLDMPKTIQVRDRATLFSLVIGLNGFTVSSGIIDRKLNSPSIIARPLEMEGSMRIGLIRKKNVVFSRYADSYVKASVDRLRQHRDSGVSVEHRNDSWSFDIAKAAKRYTFSGSFFIGFFSTFPAQTAEAWGTAPDDRRAYRKSARFYSAGAVHRSWLQDRPD